jgi:hypothetical protein
MTRTLAILCLTLLAATPQPKGNTMTRRANGTFEVKVQPIAGEGAFPRHSAKKTLHGDLEGTSEGEMMSVTSEDGSGAYAAIERVTGTLHGRKGSFALVHSGTMRRGGEFDMIIRVVPESGTGELTGLTGTMQIVIEGRDHSYHFDYALPETAR